VGDREREGVRERERERERGGREGRLDLVVRRLQRQSIIRLQPRNEVYSLCASIQCVLVSLSPCSACQCTCSVCVSASVQGPIG
jgi:hypothetical protein